MKKTDRIRKEAEKTMEKIRAITRHIRNVEDNCVLLGTKLIERGDIELGHQLIANGMVHDASKFYGIEFENLSSVEPCVEETSKLKLKMAIHHHQKTNLHHPTHKSIRDASFCWIPNNSAVYCRIVTKQITSPFRIFAPLYESCS